MSGRRRRRPAGLGPLVRLICVASTLFGGSVVLGDPSANAACGSRGGPGYRDPRGRCVGWAEIGRICGAPPSQRCSPELAADAAPDAADHGKTIDAMKRRAHAAGSDQP